MVLQNNAGDDLTVSSGANSFSFATKVTGAYAVTVKTQPTGLACTVSNGSGTATANVSNVSISCVVTSIVYSGLKNTGIVCIVPIVYAPVINIANDTGLTWDDIAFGAICDSYDNFYTTLLQYGPGAGGPSSVRPAGIGNLISIFAENATIDNSQNWIADNTGASFSDLNNTRNWNNNGSGYFAFRMINGANTYYGWMFVSVSNWNADNVTITVRDWAFNSTSGASIKAGQTN